MPLGLLYQVVRGFPPNTGMKNYTRFGYTLKVNMTCVLKPKDFARWQARERLSDATLCVAVKEMESGLIDADLGGFL